MTQQNNFFAWIACTVFSVATIPASADDSVGIDTWVDEQVSSSKALSVSAMVMEDGELRYVAGGVIAPGGEAPEPATRYQIGSITKVFTNLLLAEAVERDVVDYDTTIKDILGDRIDPSNAAVADITFAELATHTSGLPRLQANFAPKDPLNPYKDLDTEMLYAGVNISRDLQPLGDHYAYSNFGMGLSGHMLGIAFGADYAAAVTEHVIKPLGLANTAFERGDNYAVGFSEGGVVPAWTFGDATAAAGALWGSAEDFATLASVFLRESDWPLKHDIDLNEDVVAESGSGFSVTRVWHVAWANDQPIFWHNGGTGGYSSFFGYRPDTKSAIAILVSGRDGPTAFGLDWLGRTKNDMQDNESTVDTSILGQYELTPSIGAGVFERNGTVFAQLTGQQAIPMSRLDEDWYALDVVDASLRFIREDDAVVAFDLAQNSMLQRAKKVADVATAEAREEVELTSEELTQYVGSYAINANAKFVIREREGGLEAMLTGQPFLPIYAAGDDVFFYKVVDAELRFQRDEDGSVGALVLKQGAINQRAERIDD